MTPKKPAKRLSFIITEPEKLLSFLTKKLDYSGKAIKRAIDQGAVRCNGVIERFSSTQLSKGDQLTFDTAKLSTPKPLSLPILQDHEEFLICHKPAGLVTSEEGFEKLLQIPILLVHRLDKETSGVILLAKTKGMQKKLEDLFRQREVTKTYLAIVKGTIKKDSGVIESRLGKKASYQGQTIWGSHREGRLAVTEWECLKRDKEMTLLACHPITGRTHQIRVHLSEMGYPILGDHQYGRKVLFPPEVTRLCLHAYRLTFYHPDTGKKIQAIAPIPSLFKELMHFNYK